MFQFATAHIESYYAATATWPEFERLQDAIDVDVLIVGAGFSGLHTALKLVEAQDPQSVAIIEASRIAWGASGRNGGQAILGWSCDMAPIEADLGHDEALQMWQDMVWAAEEIKSLPIRHGFDIDYHEGHLWCAVKPQRVASLKAWVDEAAQKWQYPHLRFVSKNDLPQYIASERYQAGVVDEGGGHLNPMKLCYGMVDALQKAGVSVFEQTPALYYERTSDGFLVTTPQGRVRCQRLVLACNAYVDELHPPLNRRMLPVGCLQVATEVLPESQLQALLPQNHCVTDNQFILDYFRRSDDNRLLFGGGCTYLGGLPKNIDAHIKPMLTRVFPQLKDVKIDYAWGGHLDCTVRRTPDVGEENGLYWLQGFSGHGILPTLAAARAVSEAIVGQTQRLRRYQALHNPTFWGNQTLAAPIEAISKLYYRMRDVI